jgi:hypothetical protein
VSTTLAKNNAIMAVTPAKLLNPTRQITLDVPFKNAITVKLLKIKHIVVTICTQIGQFKMVE